MEAVTDQLQDLPMNQFVHSINGFHKIVNSTLDPSIRMMTSDDQVQHQTQSNTVFRDFLCHSTMMKSHSALTLQQMFSSWMHATKRHILKRQMDKVAREHKKLKRRELFQQAHEASQARDTRRFF